MVVPPNNPDTPTDPPTVSASSRTVTVLVRLDLKPELLDRISSVNPSVRVAPLGTRDGAEQWKPLEGEALDRLLAEGEIFFGFGPPAEWMSKMPNLRWIQLSSAGADNLLRQGVLRQRPEVKVTTASGIHEVPISEHILGMMLYFSRGFDEAVQAQRSHEWKRYQPDELYRKTVCFIGYGPIARRAAQLCAALGMRATCVRASIKEQQAGEGPIERFFPASDLNAALAQSDYVVVAAPRTPQTEGMMGREQFAAMKDGAVLVNISRGALVDEPALIDALRSGKLGGAGLDVFTQEPLPADSPLWDIPDVLITPHNAGANPYYNERATELFCDNLARYLAGEPLRNLVDIERGY